MKTEFEKMRSEELYDFSDAEIDASLRHAKMLCARLQTMTPYDNDYRAVIEDLIPGIPASANICPPFSCDHGNGIRLAEGVFMNYGCVILDGAYVTVGRNTLIGPHCQLYTPQHPKDHVLRRRQPCSHQKASLMTLVPKSVYGKMALVEIAAKFLLTHVVTQ